MPRIGGLGIFIGGRRRGGGITTPEAIDDMNLWNSGRSGLVIPNAVTPGTNDASILPAYTSLAITDTATLATAFINTSSGYIEALINVVDGEVQEVLSSNKNDENLYFGRVRMQATRKPQIYFKNNTVFTNNISANDAISAGWHIIRWGSTGSAYYINVDGAPVAITATAGLNNGKWFDLVPNRNLLCLGLFSGLTITHTALRCAYIAADNTNLWICNNYKYFYDVIGSLHVPIINPNPNAAKPIAYGGSFTHLFDYGYSLYERAGTNYKLQIPHKTDGTAITSPPIPVTYSFVREIAGDSEHHNLTDSLINIPGDEWDRSDATICTDAARSLYTYYDAANPNRWPVVFLNRQDFSTVYYNTNYQGRAFMKILNNSVNSRLSLRELFSYSANKSGAELTSILTYTGDNQTFAGIKYYNLVFEGHSMLSDYGNPAYQDLTTQIRYSLGALANVKMLLSAGFGVPGAVTADLVARKAALVTPCYYVADGVKNVIVVFVGCNSITGSAGAGIAAYNDLHAYIDGLIADGWTPVIITMPNRKMTPDGLYGYTNANLEIQRDIFNAALLANPDFDYIVDCDLIPELADGYDPIYFVPPTAHLTEASNIILGNAVALKILEIP